MSEHALQDRIRLAVGRVPHARLFRNVVAKAWAGKLISASDGLVTLARAQRIVAGLAPGSSDLVGWTTVTITPDMVGARVAVFTSGEVKTDKGRFEDGQENWLRVVSAAGGFADVLRSEDDALRLVRAAPRLPA